MDPNGHIYELTDAEKLAAFAAVEESVEETETISKEQIQQLREDVARMHGYLKGRADSDAPLRGKGANKDLAG